jgi:hypothetical protein
MRIVVAAIVGGLIVFIWGAVAHMALPMGEMGLSVLPDETRLMEFVRTVPSSGMYFYPGMNMSGKPTPEQLKAHQEMVTSGPSGLLILTKSNGGMTPQRLIIELVSNILAALVAAILVSLMIGGYVKRALAVALFGLFGVFSLLLSYWNWYGFPTAFVAGETITEVVGWLLAGFAIAKIVRPPFVQIVPTVG